MERPHIPVLLDETIQHLCDGTRPLQRVIDGTLGAGGHTRALLDAGAEHVLAFDLDPQALDHAEAALQGYEDRVTIVHNSYRQMARYAHIHGWQQVDAILLDLGVSSMQMDTAERGFAFSHDGPLDMRFFNQSDRETAADIVNTWSADDLADIFYRYGEERHSRKLARDIVAGRPFATTTELADFIAGAMPGAHKSKIHPATRIFQALRIAVNDELRVIEETLPDAIGLLAPGGRLAVISFHSLEDRIVKQVFKEASTAIVAPPGMASIEEKDALVDLVTRKPITPTKAEIARNPRSRSSKLRIVEKR